MKRQIFFLFHVIYFQQESVVFLGAKKQILDVVFLASNPISMDNFNITLIYQSIPQQF